MILAIALILQPREQSKSVASVDGISHLWIRKLILIQSGGVEVDDPIMRIRRITSVEDMSRLRELLQNGQHVLMTSHRHIVVEVTSLAPELLNLGLCLAENARRPTDEEGKGASGMREDDLAVGVVLDRLVVDHVQGGLGRLEGVADDGLGEAADLTGIDWVRGVNQNNRRPAVELSPDVLEVWVTEVVVARSVASEQGHSIRLEDIKSIRNFLKGKLFVEKVRERGEEAVLFGLVIADFGSELIRLPRKIG